LATYEWLTERGVEFVLLSTGATGETSRMHASLPGQAARALHDRVLAHPRATYLSNTPARKLVRGAAGRVSGVSVGRDDEESVIAVGRGVVLASGGFNRSPQLLQIFAPRWVDAVKMGGTENTGDGLRMAWALGAQLADMAYIEASFGASAAGDPEHGEDPDREPILLYPNVQGAVIVNSEGHRFIDEGLNYKRISAVCEEQPNGLAFQVFDQAMMDRSTTTPGPWNFKAALADGYLRRGDTIEQLAVELGVDPAALQATIERYNRFADDGVDADFGRIIHGHGAPTGGRIAVPPFYAFPSTSGLTTTYCGVKVDETLQVIDVFGEPIAGLFAAGEVVGGFHGAGYLSGTAMGKAAIFGRTAGISAARA
jgi:fumarate reductase flavoprotein subunit